MLPIGGLPPRTYIYEVQNFRAVVSTNCTIKIANKATKRFTLLATMKRNNCHINQTLTPCDDGVKSPRPCTVCTSNLLEKLPTLCTCMYMYMCIWMDWMYAFTVYVKILPVRPSTYMYTYNSNTSYNMFMSIPLCHFFVCQFSSDFGSIVALLTQQPCSIHEVQ